MIRILSPATDQEWRDAGTLMSELKDWDLEQSRALGLDAGEVARFFYPDVDHMTGRFLLLAMDGHSPVGCAAMYRLDESACELHSVTCGRPAAERHRRPAGAAARGAGEGSGLSRMRLETATFMGEAQKLYAALGFRVREPYRAFRPSSPRSRSPWKSTWVGRTSVPISGGRRRGAARRRRSRRWTATAEPRRTPCP